MKIMHRPLSTPHYQEYLLEAGIIVSRARVCKFVDIIVCLLYTIGVQYIYDVSL